MSILANLTAGFANSPVAGNLAAGLLLSAALVTETVQAQPAPAPRPPGMLREDVRLVSPALDAYVQERVLNDLWKRPGLNPRDRSIITVSILIARNGAAEMPNHFNLALDNGVTPGELSEIVTHLAFYAGLPNAMAAVSAARDVFAARGIGPDQLPAVSPRLLPLDKDGEDRRVATVASQFQTVSPSMLEYTTDILFRDLWLRPDLAPRDRSLVTVSALIAAGQTAQITPHLNKAMDNGLTKAEASEMVTHAAFYGGWPNAFSAMVVMKSVFEGRGV